MKTKQNMQGAWMGIGCAAVFAVAYMVLRVYSLKFINYSVTGWFLIDKVNALAILPLVLAVGMAVAALVRVRAMSVAAGGIALLVSVLLLIFGQDYVMFLFNNSRLGEAANLATGLAGEQLAALGQNGAESLDALLGMPLGTASRLLETVMSGSFLKADIGGYLMVLSSVLYMAVGAMQKQGNRHDDGAQNNESFPDTTRADDWI